MISDPLLSVCLITYNHEKYVRQALEGILMQKVNFPIEVIIADDCSTDSTREIILEYKEKYPELIKLIFQKKNVGAAKNWKDLISSPAGKYIAYFEGDDYWINPLKLQKQVDFLEANESYSICFHNVKRVDEIGKDLKQRLANNYDVEKIFTIEDLAKVNFIHTVSVVLKKNLERIPEWINYSPAGDYPLHLINATYGLIKYFPEEMAAYRVGSGIWSSQTEIDQIINTMFVVKLMSSQFKNRKQVTENLENQNRGLLLKLESIILKNNSINNDEEKIAYNLSLKKLVIILLKKIKYSFS